MKKIKNPRIQCIQDYIKWNRKKQKNVLHLNNIRMKNTLLINKAYWIELHVIALHVIALHVIARQGNAQLWMCIIIRANYIIIIIIRRNSRYYSAKHEGFLCTPEIYWRASAKTLDTRIYGQSPYHGWDIHCCVMCRIYMFYQQIVGSIARDNQILHLAPWPHWTWPHSS